MTALLLSIALKGLIVLAAAFGLLALLRGAPPALRHGVWTAAFAALLAVSVLGAFGPGWAMPLLPTSGVGLMERVDEEVIICDDSFECEPVAAMSSGDWPALPGSGRSSVEFLDHLDHAHGVAPVAVIETADGHVWTKPSLGAVGLWLLGAWALGALVVGLRWVAAYASAAFVVRGAVRVTDEGWLDGAERARRLLGIDREVRLLVSDRLTVPVAWGWGAPAVVLPPDADGWDEDRRDAVLLHELAHVRRGDARTQFVAQLALVLHWPNPLAWLAYRRFLTEREHACDDAVLSGGATPSAYAGHLVDIARNAGREPRALAALAPMARRSDLEHRVVAVLDAGRRRVAAGRSTLARAVVLGLCIAAPLGVLRPVAAASDESVTAASAGFTPDLIQDMDAEPIGDIDEMFDDLGEMDADGEHLASGDASLPEALRDTIPRAEDVLGPARASTLAQVRRMRADGLGLDDDAWNEIEREVQSAFDDAHADYDAIVDRAVAESLADAGEQTRRAVRRSVDAARAAAGVTRSQSLREAQQDREEALREAAQERREAQRDREEALREAQQDREEALREARQEREEALREAQQEREEAQREARRERSSNRTSRQTSSRTTSRTTGYAYSTQPDGTVVSTRTDAAVGPWMAEMDGYDHAIESIGEAAAEVRRRGARPGEVSGLRGGLAGLRGAVESMASRHSWPQSTTERGIARARIGATRARLDAAQARIDAIDSSSRGR